MTLLNIEIEMSEVMIGQGLPVLAAKYGIDLSGLDQAQAVNAISQQIANEVLADVRTEIASAAANEARAAKLSELSD